MLTKLKACSSTISSAPRYGWELFCLSRWPESGTLDVINYTITLWLTLHTLSELYFQLFQATETSTRLFLAAQRSAPAGRSMSEENIEERGYTIKSNSHSCLHISFALHRICDYDSVAESQSGAHNSCPRTLERVVIEKFTNISKTSSRRHHHF